MIIKVSRWIWHIIKAIMDWCRIVFTKITKVEIKDSVWDVFVQFVKFGLVGFSNTIISYATYYILVPLHVNKYIASVIGFVLSVANAFYWNNSYVFKKDDATEERNMFWAFIKLFLSYAGTGLVLHNALLWLWTDMLHISDYIAPIINLFITIPLNFVLNKLWAFRTKKKEQGQK